MIKARAENKNFNLGIIIIAKDGNIFRNKIKSNTSFTKKANITKLVKKCTC